MINESFTKVGVNKLGNNFMALIDAQDLTNEYADVFRVTYDNQILEGLISSVHIRSEYFRLQMLDGMETERLDIKNIKHERWELAIEILKKYQHRGYGRQALAAFMDKVRDCTGVCDFIARVDPENTVSQSMCEALAGVPEKITEHLLHDQEYMEQYEKENAHEVTDDMRRLAMKFNVAPEKLLTHVLQYRFDMRPGVSELAKLLWQIKDAYWDYVVGVIIYAKKKPERMKIVTEYVKSHMDATTSDIVWFISNQPDFHDDAAPCYEDDEDV